MSHAEVLDEINVFLRSVGFSPWSTQNSLFKTWFVPQFLPFKKFRVYPKVGEMQERGFCAYR